MDILLRQDTSIFQGSPKYIEEGKYIESRKPWESYYEKVGMQESGSHACTSMFY